MPKKFFKPVATAAFESVAATATFSAHDTATRPKPKGDAIPQALAAFDQLPDSGFVRLRVVTALNSISPATAWRWVRDGRLPAPIKLSQNVTVWRVGDLRQAMAKAG